MYCITMFASVAAYYKLREKDKLFAGVIQHSLAVMFPVYIHYKMPCPSVRLDKLGIPVSGQLLTFNESFIVIRAVMCCPDSNIQLLQIFPWFICHKPSASKEIGKGISGRSDESGECTHLFSY